jgi:hypothetical protein
MSRADYALKRLPILSRLATLLRRVSGVQVALAKLQNWLGGAPKLEPAVAPETCPPASDAVGAGGKSDAPVDAIPTDEIEPIHEAKTSPPPAQVPTTESSAESVRCDVSSDPHPPEDREALVRRRWQETGIRMWNPRSHGAGHATLCIQGHSTLLPPKPGDRMPAYDRLEFTATDGRIVCEGFVLTTLEAGRPFG